jgi:hypothetical protein
VVFLRAHLPPIWAPAILDQGTNDDYIQQRVLILSHPHL